MEPTYCVDDVLILKECSADEVSEGDVVTFYWDLVHNCAPTDTKADGVYMMTHLLESITYYEDVSENNGYNYTFVAHGTNTSSSQCGSAENPGDCTYQKQTFHEDVLIGKVTGKSDFLRVVNKILTSVWTLIILILAPCLYLMISVIVDMIRKLDAVDNEPVSGNKAQTNGSNNALEGLTKEQKEKLKKQMLEELLNKGDKK